MKKVLFLILLFVPFLVYAQTCNTDDLIIKSITLDNDKSVGVEEKTPASINDNNLLLDLSFDTLGNTAEYLIVIKNDSNEDYELNNQINNTSDYIEYSIETNDNNIVNANSEKEILLKVEYKNEVPDSSFVDGQYSDNKTIAINLFNDTKQSSEDIIINPETGNYIILLIIGILIVGVIVYAILRNKKYSPFLILLLLIPVFTNAICSKSINIESNIQIYKQKKNYIMIGNRGITNYLRTNISKADIEIITFDNSIEGHRIDNETCFDVSRDKDGSVLAWVSDTDSNGLYELTIASNGKTTLSDGIHMFNGLSKLTKINNMVYLDTSEAKSMMNMFSGCVSLTSLDLSYFDTSNVVSMHGMFTHCKSITSIDLSNFNTSKVTDMYGLFQYCESLLNINLSNIDTSKVTRMNEMFYLCEAIKNLDLSDLDTSSVTTMYGTFYGCENLINLNISSWDTSKVTTFSNMFCLCSSLTSLDLSHLDTRNATSTSYMFDRCTNLISLDLSNFNTSKVEDMKYMFSDCTNLLTLNISSFNTSNVTDMSFMFRGCNKITTLVLTNFNTSKVTDMQNMFSNCKELTTLNITSFDTKNVTNMNDMFYLCSKLTTLDITNFNTSKVTNMRSMFQYCFKLTSIDLTHFDTSNVETMFTMFAFCKSLRELDLSSFNTIKLTNMNQMFYECHNLKTIYVSDSFVTSNVSTAGGVFYNSKLLIGGSGTTYDFRNTDLSYAHIDGGESNPGYFTRKSS